MKRAAEYLKRNSYIYITAFVLFAIGVCIGALGAAGIEDGEFSPLKEYAESFFGSAQKIAHAEVFKKCAVKNLGLVSACGICAMFVYTMPVCFVTVGFKGFTTGFAAGFILKAFGSKGALFIFSSFIPSLVFLIPVMFLMCGFCVRFAFMCHKNKIRRKKELVPFALSMSAMWAAMSIIDLTDSFVSEFVARGIF